MGCSAAVPALRSARHIVRSDPEARVLVVNLELCTLHMQETRDIETALSFLLFADGCSAALVTGEPSGLALEDFAMSVIPDSQSLITWDIANHGFLMHLSGQVPTRILQALREDLESGDGILRGEGTRGDGSYGRCMPAAAPCWMRWRPGMACRRRHCGIRGQCCTTTATCPRPPSCFVLRAMMQESTPARGLGMAFGPGMVAETIRFRRLG